MWFISRQSDGKLVYLLCNKEYTFGRKDCTVIIPDDASVSRKHLTLFVEYPEINVQSKLRPAIKIKDLGSSYGTYINPSAANKGKIEPHVWAVLKEESTLHFGIGNEWTVKWMDINVLCSAVGPAGRTKLKEELVKLGATVIPEWQDCVTYLVMDKIVFTQKVMVSLICAKPIVTVNYFESWTSVLEENPSAVPPDLGSHVPQLDKSLRQMERPRFLPRPERRTVLKGKTFLFPVEDPIMSSAIVMAGGEVINHYNQTDCILIEHSDSEPPSTDYERRLKQLKSQGLRAIPLKDIGHAILACSTKRYCNPSMNLQQTLFANRGRGDHSSTQTTVLAPETQPLEPHNLPEASDLPVVYSQAVVLESQHQAPPPPSKKIKIEPQEPGPPPNKRVCRGQPIKLEPVDRSEDHCEDRRKQSRPHAADQFSATSHRIDLAPSTAAVAIRRSEAPPASAIPRRSEAPPAAVAPRCPDAPLSVPVSHRIDAPPASSIDRSVSRPAAKRTPRSKDISLSWRSNSTSNATMDEHNLSKMIVRLSLFRPGCDVSSSSSRSSADSRNLSVTEATPRRIRSMRVASFSQGKWKVGDQVLQQTAAA